jgi:hypothetical protein
MNRKALHMCVCVLCVYACMLTVTRSAMSTLSSVRRAHEPKSPAYVCVYIYTCVYVYCIYVCVCVYACMLIVMTSAISTLSRVRRADEPKNSAIHTYIHTYMSPASVPLVSVSEF